MKMAEKKGKSLPRVNSVLNPSAQTATLCALRTGEEPTLSTTPVTDSLPKDIAPPLKAIILFLEVTGSRVSEVLNILPTHVASNGVVYIKALKGSNSRVIPAGPHTKYFLENRNSLPLIASGFNRFYVYREFKKLGIYARIGNRDINSVTHYFRHKLAADLRSSEFENTQIAAALGHKKISNSDKYGR